MTGKEIRPISHFNTILAATDFSENADLAVDWALEIAKVHNAKLIFFHCLRGGLSPELSIDYVVSAPDSDQRRHGYALEKVQELARHARCTGTDAEGSVQTGYAAPAVVDFATKSDVDLIVVGTRGRTGLKHLVLGSTAEGIARRATCPVLTVRPRNRVLHRSMRTVLIPTDFSEDAGQALHAAAPLLGTNPGGIRLVLLHALELPQEIWDVYGSAPAISQRWILSEGMARANLEEIARELRQEGYVVETVVRRGHAASTIVEVAECIDPDLIAMGTQGRSGLQHALFGSTAERVVQTAGCPVLTTRREDG